MPCFFAVIALMAPRIAVALLWFFSRWFEGLFPTLLWYSAVQRWFGGQWTLWPIVGIVIALLIDVSPAGGRRRQA